MIAETAIIHPNVKLGKNCVVEDYVVIGAPPRGAKIGELETIIGENSVIRTGTVIYAGNVIGKGFQTGNRANIRELNEIGDYVSIGTNSIVEHHVKIGDGVRLHSCVFVPEYSILEEGSWLGPHVVVTNAKYPQSPGCRDSLKGAHLEKGAIVGANSTLLPGVVIGERALVGAGSVVSHDVPPRTVVAGNPAVKIKHLSELPY